MLKQTKKKLKIIILLKNTFSKSILIRFKTKFKTVAKTIII